MTLRLEDYQAAPLTDGLAEMESLLAGAPSSISLIGDCLHDFHPTRKGRFLVTYRDACGTEHSHWLVALKQAGVQAGDRVLLLRPDNCDEPLIVGVLS